MLIALCLTRSLTFMATVHLFLPLLYFGLFQRFCFRILLFLRLCNYVWSFMPSGEWDCLCGSIINQLEMGWFRLKTKTYNLSKPCDLEFVTYILVSIWFWCLFTNMFRMRMLWISSRVVWTWKIVITYTYLHHTKTKGTFWIKLTLSFLSVSLKLCRSYRN